MDSGNSAANRRAVLKRTGAVFVGTAGVAGVASAAAGDCGNCPLDSDDFDNCAPGDTCMELNDGNCLCPCQKVHVVKSDTGVWEYGCPPFNQIDTVFPYISGTIADLCCEDGMVYVDWDDSSYADGWVSAGALEWYY